MKSAVKISNFPEGIIVNETIKNNTNILNDMVDYHKSERQQIVINDSEWFSGNIINYTLENCD